MHENVAVWFVLFWNSRPSGFAFDLWVSSNSSRCKNPPKHLDTHPASESPPCPSVGYSSARPAPRYGPVLTDMLFRQRPLVLGPGPAPL